MAWGCFGPVGRGVRVSSQAIFRLTGFRLRQDWFYWLLKGVTGFVEKQAHGIIGLVHITGEDLGAIQVPVIPEAEQCVIAAFLDRETARIDTLVTAKERPIAMLSGKHAWKLNMATSPMLAAMDITRVPAGNSLLTAKPSSFSVWV